MRVIVRFSLNNDRQSRLRNRLKPILEQHGIAWSGTNTGTYEGDIQESDLRDAMRAFWNSMNSYRGLATLDHFWMYADRPND